MPPRYKIDELEDGSYQVEIEGYGRVQLQPDYVAQYLNGFGITPSAEAVKFIAPQQQEEPQLPEHISAGPFVRIPTKPLVTAAKAIDWASNLPGAGAVGAAIQAPWQLAEIASKNIAKAVPEGTVKMAPTGESGDVGREQRDFNPRQFTEEMLPWALQGPMYKMVGQGLRAIPPLVGAARIPRPTGANIFSRRNWSRPMAPEPPAGPLPPGVAPTGALEGADEGVGTVAQHMQGIAEPPAAAAEGKKIPRVPRQAPAAAAPPVPTGPPDLEVPTWMRQGMARPQLRPVGAQTAAPQPWVAPRFPEREMVQPPWRPSASDIPTHMPWATGALKDVPPEQTQLYQRFKDLQRQAVGEAQQRSPVRWTEGYGPDVTTEFPRERPISHRIPPKRDPRTGKMLPGSWGEATAAEEEQFRQMMQKARKRQLGEFEEWGQYPWKVHGLW